MEKEIRECIAELEKTYKDFEDGHCGKNYLYQQFLVDLLYKKTILLIHLYKLESLKSQEEKLEEIRQMISCLPPSSGGKEYTAAHSDFMEKIDF